MATAQLQPLVRLELADESGSLGYSSAYIQAGASAAQGRAALAVLRAVLPTGCTAVAGEVRYEVTELDPADGAGAVFRCAVLVFRTSTPGELAVISVPGLRLDLVDPADEERVNLEAPPIAALIATLTNGAYCNPFGHILTECVAGLVELRET